MEVLIKLSDAIKTLKSMAVPLVRKLPSTQPERLTDYSFEESCTECPAYDTENHRCPRFNQVIRTALKDANLEPCENCISRQAAIDVADAVWSVTGDKNVAKVWDQIKDLPSAKPEPRWIPCSERLPDNRVSVIACYREWQQYAKRYIYSIVIGWYARKHSVRENVFSEWEGDCDYDEDEDEFYIQEGWYEFTTQGNGDLMNWYINAEVVAWMPLPEPYKEEQE